LGYQEMALQSREQLELEKLHARRVEGLLLVVLCKQVGRSKPALACRLRLGASR
jgi:hypothetical protein